MNYLNSLIEEIKKELEEKGKDIDSYIFSIQVQFLMCKILFALVIAIRDK